MPYSSQLDAGYGPQKTGKRRKKRRLPIFVVLGCITIASLIILHGNHKVIGQTASMQGPDSPTAIQAHAKSTSGQTANAVTDRSSRSERRSWRRSAPPPNTQDSPLGPSGDTSPQYDTDNTDKRNADDPRREDNEGVLPFPIPHPSEDDAPSDDPLKAPEAPAPPDMPLPSDNEPAPPPNNDEDEDKDRKDDEDPSGGNTPLPIPLPIPVPLPLPTPAPTPVPIPLPLPLPIPTPPTPNPTPRPQPQPQPQPDPVPPPPIPGGPLPVPAPQPSPVPAPQPDPDPVPRPQPGGDYYVQVHATPHEHSICEIWLHLKQTFPELFTYAEQSVSRLDTDDGSVWFRLRVGAFNNAQDANAFCARLKRDGHDCFTVHRNSGP